MKMKMTTVAKLSSRERRKRRRRRRRGNNRSSNEESSSHVNHVARSLFYYRCHRLLSFVFVRNGKNEGSSQTERKNGRNQEKHKSALVTKEQKRIVTQFELRERERENYYYYRASCAFITSEYTERFSRIDDAYTEPNAKCRRRWCRIAPRGRQTTTKKTSLRASRTRSIEFDDTLLTQKTRPRKIRKMSLQSHR